MTKDAREYYAIDSDVLHDLVYIETLNKKYGFVPNEQVKSKVISDNCGYLKTLLKMIKKDEIRILIVPTVFHECEHSKSLVDFMKNNCYMQNINQFNADRIALEADELAEAYCKGFTFNGQDFPAPMMRQYSSATRKYVPSNDAYIMAEATIAGAASVITMNVKHFIKNVREGEDDNSRVKGIVKINKIKGRERVVLDENGNQTTVCTSPTALYTIMPILKNKNQTNGNAFVSINDDRMSKMSDLINEDDMIFSEEDGMEK